MATYFHGNSENQGGGGGGGGGDGLQTLILMNPGYVGGYSDNNNNQHPPNSNFVFLNSNNISGNNNNSSGHHLPHAPPSSQTQHFVGIPLQGTASASGQDPQQQDVSALHGFLPRVHYNLYNLPIDIGAARDVTRAQQGLSLSLSSQQPPGYGSFRHEREVSVQPTMVTTVSPPRGGGGDEIRVSGGSPSSASGVSNGVNGVQSVLLSSKYLKAAQELLDEVVNVGKGPKTSTDQPHKSGQTKNTGDHSAAAATSGEGHSGGDGGSATKRAGAELTTAERQEIQMKKAKLVNMLDEVEQRYRQYHQQMQIVITWFEQAAGIGSAKTYTALALQTISKQFRCLKDAIMGQIRSASKSLGEDDVVLESGRIEGSSSRLKYVDNQIRQQRALQQLGMIQHNAWRPQRGLPERSVSVLRAWLFEHFLHPYPKDSDKIMLAKQTGLTRSQVSNWFINARVRLWKPMVEEMYTEEMKENEKNNNGSSEDDKIINNINNKTEHHNEEYSTPKSTTPLQDKSPQQQQQQQQQQQHQNKSFVISRQDNNNNNNMNISGFNLIGSSSEIETTTIARESPKKLRISDMLMSKSNDDADNESMSRDGGFTLMGGPTNFIGGFGSYAINELGRFEPDHFQQHPYLGNGVSLTLGLPHCDNQLTMSSVPHHHHHQAFMPTNQGMQLGRRVEIGETNDYVGMNAQQPNTHPTNVYENINIQNRKRFAAQLLPDFVA
ncbi:hypothetical protein ABFS83_10G080300 [Erythranthe nasuta]